MSAPDSARQGAPDNGPEMVISLSSAQSPRHPAPSGLWAAFLFILGPLLIWLAVNAAIAYRLFCWIAKVCG